MREMSETKSILEAARAKIADSKNWSQGYLTSPANMFEPKFGDICAGDAIASTSDSLQRVGYAYEALAHVIDPTLAIRSSHLGEFITTVIDWNDVPERTHTQVLEAFDKAIKSVSV